ncbi:hypothetical protein NE237_010540 [Protea cynaroides]|uniref:RING-type E3 ubiquitin transferase n=1 Tax=Protea cynaroides TaxID=273540 RepID=A0A9Q0KZZ8_9MAGN|nr:hypothetical protein NE237_010540 [Protea cynaroides]
MGSSDWSNQIIPNMDSYDGKVMLAAIISLLLVIIFVLLLHIYTRWLLEQAQRQRRRSMFLSHVSGPTRFHHARTFAYDGPYFGCSTHGIDASIISALPIFVYKSDEYKNGLECVVCLSVFEEDEMGRSLPKCNHAFHVQCIDMWLQSHSSCPICRATVALDKSIGIRSPSTDVQPVEESRDAAPVVMSSESAIARESPTTLDVLIDVSVDPNGVVLRDTASPSSPPPPPPPPPPPESSSSSLGWSLKRMLSRNRSECKVFPSFNLKV